MQEKIQGFIIKIVSHRDNSKIITLYSDKLGKVTVAANIPEKISGGSMGVYDLGNAVEAVLYRKKEDEMFKLTEINLVKQYPNIHFNYEKICVLNYVLYALDRNTEENYGDRTLMNFLKLYMRLLEQGSLTINKMIFLFDFYFLTINGVLGDDFKDLSETERLLISELSGKILLKEGYEQYISSKLIKQMNSIKKNKMNFLDIQQKM